MPTPVPLSVVIIAKNEEGRIKGCLDSVRWAAELIVVDDWSTDRTAAIARRYTDRVIQRAMEVEGSHRNHAYSLASHEWILSLDADERVTPELRAEIASLLATNPPLNGYTIPRRNYLGQRWLRHGGFYPSPQLRLFRQGHFKYEEVEVHPRAFLDTETGCLHGDLIHHSYRNLEDFVAKLNRQTTLEATKWRNDGRSLGVGKGLWRTVDRFVRTYWGKQGYRDGLLGFIMAVLGGVYQFLSFAKYWFASASSPSRTPPARGASGPAAREARGGHGAEPSEASPCRARSEESARWADSSGAGRTTPSNRWRADGAARPRQTISAVILTKNEAHQIRRCLEAIRWVDEIIVVDGESTDGTPEICREHGATVVTHRFEGDFGQERNIGNAHATKDWILQLDADDLVTDEFRQAAEDVLRNGSPHAAYQFRRTNCFLGHWMRYGGWDHYSLHFFRRGKARYQGRVHHALLVDGSVGIMEATIEHYPFDSIEQFIDRQNRYTSLEALELAAQRDAVSENELRYQLVMKPIKLFWKLYVKKQGFRDGMHGLIFAGLYSFVHFLKWAKYWELSADTPMTSTSSGPRQTLSAVILTRNEAANIHRCLESLRWVDEIVVVDGESTDGTPEICREHGATVVTRRLDGHFGQQRNVGSGCATKDWVLQLDADEVVTEEFHQEVERILHDGSPHAAYQFRRKNYFLGRWMRYGGWFHYRPQLFRRGKARYEGRVHERLLVDGSIGVLETSIEHYPFDSLVRFVDRQNYYTSLAALELVEGGAGISLRALRYQLMVKPIKLFWKLYVKKQGFRNGMHGLIFAGLYSFIHFLKWAKVWERLRVKERNTD